MLSGLALVFFQRFKIRWFVKDHIKVDNVTELLEILDELLPFTLYLSYCVYNCVHGRVVVQLQRTTKFFKLL